MKVLVTGGAGYIGSHTVVELLAADHEVVIVDNFSNSSPKVLRRLQKITGETLPFYEVDVRDSKSLEKIFNQNNFDAAIHFAGLKAVGESVKQPLEYYRNNLDSTLSLLETMKQHSVQKLVFSSSATVYGTAKIPYIETHTTGVGIPSPYGQAKYMIEQILRDSAASNEAWQITALRYFNPIGAHESGLIGEDPIGIPNNLMPFVSQVASGQREYLSVFGNDYPTPDGTCIRDYLHVVDLAKGHVAALEKTKPGFDAINLGSGKGTSVLELVKAFQNATGQKVPYKIAPRREGDLPEFYADATKAAHQLGWKTEKSIEDACRDSWRWQSKNPNGY
jgi:UDP-glucose 4-epimerase